MKAQWGKHTWILFHTLSIRIKEESFPIIGPQLIQLIINTCKYLPCPECSSHATKFLSKCRLSTIRTRKDLIHLLYIFHNCVNHRKHAATFPYEKLENYKHVNIAKAAIAFQLHFQTKGNMRLIIDSFHRTTLVKRFIEWIYNNLHHFE